VNTTMTRSAHGLDTGTDHNWRTQGACNKYNPDWWTASLDDEATTWARYICRTECPVQNACRNWADHNKTLAGGATYGGIYWCVATNGRPPRQATHQPPPFPPQDRAPRMRTGHTRRTPSTQPATHHDQIIEWLRDGTSTSDVADRLGCTPDAVRSYLHNRGLRACDIRAQRAQELHQQGLTHLAIATRIGMSKSRIGSILRAAS